MNQSNPNQSNFSLMQAIKNRTSIRTYLGQPLTEAQKQAFLAYIDQQKSIFEPSVRFAFFDQDPQSEFKLGTYGVIKNAATFAIAAVQDKPYNMEELGYKLEKGILYATNEGLGTCWLGGTFNRADLKKAITLNDNEHIPALTPIGKPAEKRRALDIAMRTLVGATKRKPFKELFFDVDFNSPLAESPSSKDPYHTALEMVRLAPSASNKQPWRVVRTTTGFHFYLAHTKNYPETAQRMDMGIAMCHFESAAQEMGLPGSFVIKNPAIHAPEGVDYSFTWICG